MAMDGHEAILKQDQEVTGEGISLSINYLPSSPPYSVSGQLQRLLGREGLAISRRKYDCLRAGLLGELILGLVRMQPLLFQAHIFLVCLSHLLTGVIAQRGAGLGSGSSSGLTHSSQRNKMAKELKEIEHAEPKKLFWTEMYVPVRRCHVTLKNKMGEFSIPVTRKHHFKNIWCNWTIWAGPRNHIIIYIQGFRGSKDCEENTDKIIFQGIASVVESTIIYACWNKRLHVYATQALGVNVALLSKNYAWSRQYKHFRGKYYIFRDPRAKVSEKEVLTFQGPFQRPSNKLPSSTGLKVEFPAGMSHIVLEMTSSDLMPSKALQPGRSLTWGKEKVEFSGTSLPCSERLFDKSFADSIMVTKTLGMGQISLGDGLLSNVLGKTSALETKWSNIIEEKSIPSPGFSMDGSAIDGNILYENIPSRVSPEQSTIMEDWPVSFELGRADNHTDYLIPTSEGVPVNIKPTPRSHSLFILLSDSEFLEKTECSKNEKLQISPSQIWSSLAGSEQQPFLQTEVLTHDLGTLSTDSRGNHMSGISLISDTQLPLEGSLHLIPVVPTIHTAVDFSSKSFKDGDLPSDPHFLEIIQTPGDGMIWLNSREVSSEAGFTLRVESPDGIGLVPELPSTIFPRSAFEGEPEQLLQAPRSLPGPVEIGSLVSNVSSEEVLSRNQMNLAETVIKFVLGQERSLPFTIYQESLSDNELTPTPSQVAVSETVPEWVLQNISVSIPWSYHNEQVTTEQPLEVPLALTPETLLKAKGPSMTRIETRAEIDSMLIVQSINTPFASVNDEEHRMASVFSLEIPLSHDTHFSKDNMEYHFFSPTAMSLAFLPTPTLNINEDELILSMSSNSCANSEEMFTNMGKTEPLPLFTSRNVDLPTSVSSPIRLALSLENLFDLSESKHFIEKETRSVSQLVPKSKLSQGRDASSGSRIPLGTKTYYEMTPLSTLQWTSGVTPSWELDEIQNEVTVQSSKKDAMVNEPWESSNSLKKDQKFTQLNFTALLPSVPIMSLGKQDLSTVSTSLPLWFKETNLLEAKKLQDSSEVFISTRMVACIPIRRCHVVFKDAFGTFSLPENLNSSWSNICCNWTIWVGSKKHIVVYIKGFEGPENCDQSQDRIIFQGISSSVETKTFYACGRQSTLIFAAQALAVHIVFLSVRSYPKHIPSFEGQYFVFTNPEKQVPPKLAVGSSLATSQRLGERTLNSMDSSPEVVSITQSGNFLSLNTISLGLEKSQMVTETVMLKNKELVEGEGKTLGWKHLHGFFPLIPTKGPLIRYKTPSPTLLMQELGSPTETIKNSAGRDGVMALRMTSIPITSYGNKPENKASEKNLSLSGLLDSLIHHLNWPSKTFPWTELLPKSVGISDRLLPSARVGEENLPGNTTKTEKLIQQEDLVITKPSNLYSHLTVQTIRKPQDVVNNHNLYQSSSHVMLVKGKNFLEIRPRVDESNTEPSNIPKEDLFSNLQFNDEYLAPESSATGKERGEEIFPTRDEVSKGISLDPAQSISLENIKHLNGDLPDLGSSRKVTTSSEFVWDSVSPGTLTELSPSLKTPCTDQNFLKKVVSGVHPILDAAHSSAPTPNFTSKQDWQAKAMGSLIPDQAWNNITADEVLVLTPEYTDARPTSPSFGNESVLEFQHHPGDILYEVTVEMERQVEAAYDASEVEKVLVDSFNQEIGENLGHFSPEADAFKLTRIKRKDTSNVTFIFWLFLRSSGKNMSDNLMSQFGGSENSALQLQIRTFIRNTVKALQLHLKSVSIHDVNECEIGLQQCGEGAECFNGVGTYLCHCKEDYEDHSPKQTGILCIHVPPSGVGFYFNYLDLLISATVFATILLMLIISFVWLASRTTQKKRDFCLQETMSLEGLSALPQTQTRSHSKLRKFTKYALYNPYESKPQARVMDGSLEQIPYLSKDSHVCMEQSESL
ncbi:uncharacterized protein LOC100927735 [Sarcophilus harrisii]|uniref:uncharacterized protein LOC100927735 n=1 Tax=Sarcophilus harrisii TaxID=9305 RepID=UPI001301F872|nr:uncharacterized protein LOC100927735 [Sarcophilus harrisii]